MSYDIYMNEPNSDETIEFSENHDFKGGTYAMGGTKEAWINITWNYGKFYYETIDSEKGIRWIYGKTGRDCFDKLNNAVKVLGVKTDKDYWKATKGNAGHALLALIAFCIWRPDGVFDGD